MPEEEDHPLEDMADDFERLEALIDQMGSNNTRYFGTISTRISELEDKVDTLEAGIDSLDNRLAAIGPSGPI